MLTRSRIGDIINRRKVLHVGADAHDLKCVLSRAVQRNRVIPESRTPAGVLEEEPNASRH